MVMNPSFNGTSISNGTRLSFDVSTPLSSPGQLIHFPNPNILKQGYAGYNIGNILSTTLPYPRCHTTMRKSRHFVPNECKDEYYWHKRLKNNEAARKSRQKRRTIDSVLEEKVLILLHENQLLRQELYALKVKHGELTPSSSDHQQESSSSAAESILDCSKLSKSGSLMGTGGGGSTPNNVALTNKLISQALAKSDEKRIGLRQSLLETINMSLSKENDGKHKLFNPHHHLHQPQAPHQHIPDTETLLYGAGGASKPPGSSSSSSGAGSSGASSSSSGAGSSSNGGSSMPSTPSGAGAKFPSEFMANLSSGAYVLTSLSPGSEDIHSFPSMNGCSPSSSSAAAASAAAGRLSSSDQQQPQQPQQQPMMMMRKQSSSGSSTSSGVMPYQQQQQQNGENCSTDEKAMEAANTLANLFKRSGSTHSNTSSLDRPLSPLSPSPGSGGGGGGGGHMSHHPAHHQHICPPHSPTAATASHQLHMSIQHHIQKQRQQQQQQQRQHVQHMITNESEQQQMHNYHSAGGGSSSSSTTPAQSPAPSSSSSGSSSSSSKQLPGGSSNGGSSSCLPHKLRFKESNKV